MRATSSSLDGAYRELGKRWGHYSAGCEYPYTFYCYFDPLWTMNHSFQWGLVRYFLGGIESVWHREIDHSGIWLAIPDTEVPAEVWDMR